MKFTQPSRKAPVAEPTEEQEREAKRRKVPAWLDLDAPQSDKAKPRACPRCHRMTIIALADGVAPVRADLVELSAASEQACILRGEVTLELTPRVLLAGSRRVKFRDSRHALRMGHGLCIGIHACERDRGLPDYTLLLPSITRGWRSPGHPDGPREFVRGGW